MRRKLLVIYPILTIKRRLAENWALACMGSAWYGICTCGQFAVNRDIYNALDRGFGLMILVLVMIPIRNL